MAWQVGVMLTMIIGAALVADASGSTHRTDGHQTPYRGVIWGNIGDYYKGY